MIAASEPMEFIPRGRSAVEEHPGPMESQPHPYVPVEHVLLQRMQNVNISETERHSEFWSIREIYDDSDECNKSFEQSHKRFTNQSKTINYGNTCQQKISDYICDFFVNSEEELYVKRCTAVWSRGLENEHNILPPLCFTCDTPIKFAFFCNNSFGSNEQIQSKENARLHEVEPKEDITAICLIDHTSLHVYCSNGEDFLTNLEFPILNVWQTRHGVLLEKEASNTIIQNHSIPMPRVFSLAHPLDEICPMLYKSSTNTISYLVETDLNIVFSAENFDLILLFDNKIGKHSISKLRRALEEEIHSVGIQNDSVLAGTAHHSINRASASNFSQKSVKLTGATPKSNSSHLGRTSFGNMNYSTHISKFLSNAHSLGSAYGSLKTTVTSPLSHLHSTIGQHSISVQDIRKGGECQPSRPIVPQLCLEHIWIENTIGSNCDFCEVSTRAFVHTDLLGQNFFCYLLPRSCKLVLVCLYNNSEGNVAIGTMSTAIAAKDALSIERMNMIAVLDPAGCLVLYSGTAVISKVHIPPISVPSNGRNATTSTGHATSPDTSFPRRSSLLPSIQKTTDSTFDDELHMLSPVHPLQQFPVRNTDATSNSCMGLRDATGNRLTLLYTSGKMYRISLPLINETKFITRCIATLRQILNGNKFMQMITRWYGARNPPGSRDYSINQEWNIFKSILLELMGYPTLSLDSSGNASMSFNAEEPKKRRKNHEIVAGSNDDWKFMLSVLNGNDRITSSNVTNLCIGVISRNACLFQMIPAIFYGFHLLYEDFKLDESMLDYLHHLAKFLYQLALDMQLPSFTFHYALDYPKLLETTTKTGQLTEEQSSQMLHRELLQSCAPSFYEQLGHILKGRDVVPFAYIKGINDLSRNILQIISLIIHGHDKMKAWIKPLEFSDSVRFDYTKPKTGFISTTVPRSVQVIQMLIRMGLKRKDLERLPVALHLIIAECLEHSRLSPPVGFSSKTYELILRSELVQHSKLYRNSSNFFQKSNTDEEDSLSSRCSPSTTGISHMEAALDDGMDNIDTKLLSLRFPDDMRIMEVRRLLCSSEPVVIEILQSPGTSDHEFIEEQEKQLFALCTRTMALPMGRGMFTLRTSIPTPTESMPIPKLCLIGKEPIKGATIEMQQIEFPANMSLWPTFHNGVAAGLKISPQARDVDSTWIVYNKPKNQTDISTEHAGFLMALGLNDHLKTLSFMSIYEYLVKCDEMTSIGLLLGISATHRGTMDNTTTKLLSVHIEALLPATALELDIPQNIQVASLMGIGLLYQSTAKRHIAEVLLQEIGRPPGPEMENSIERESYALTAGLALGLVTLGQGESPAGLRDLQLPDTLHYYMVGGNRRPLTGSQKEKYKLPSFQVREGENVNIDVTAPGATLALGLMFFNTDNRAISDWMEPPNTRYLLELVRPDLLLLRIIARGLILWSSIKPDENWLFGQFPANLKFDIDRGALINDSDNIDHEGLTQAYCNVIAGAAFCIGLKFAGTENQTAFKSLRRAIKTFLGFPGKYVGEYAGRTTIESCLLVILIAISLVFAGSGDLEILRIIRYLRSRIGVAHSQVTYGSHMAIHLSLGLLFLGAGRFTIAKTADAVAALVCAFFPKFPNHSNDNRYHLQAFRHLYVLAVEPRLFLPRDIDTKKLCLCNLSILEVGSSELKHFSMAPCMLPELNTLQKVVINDPNYWPVSFERNRNWEQLMKALENTNCIDIKKRSGCLSYLEDPDRLKSLFAQTLTTEQYICWEIDPVILERFSNDPVVIAFIDRFLYMDDKQIDEAELSKSKHLTLLFYNAVIRDKMHVLPIFLSIFDHILRIRSEPSFADIWQIKLIKIYIQIYEAGFVFLSKEILQSAIEKFEFYIENVRDQHNTNLRRFLMASTHGATTITNFSEFDLKSMMAVINFYNLTPNLLNLANTDGSLKSYFTELCKLNLDTFTIFCIIKIMQKAID